MGHIPSKSSNKIKILSFEEAKNLSLKSDDYDASKWIYYPNFYSDYRYILGTVGNNPLITIGINPSTAAPDNLDNTLKSVERKALQCGFDSFVMFNVYAQRATDPSYMDKELNEKLHKQNMIAFDWVLHRSNCNGQVPSIWAAWGSIIEKRPYLKDCLCDMLKIGEKYKARWLKAGPLLKSGHPHHPLYLRNEYKLDAFDLDNYLKNL